MRIVFSLCLAVLLDGCGTTAPPATQPVIATTFDPQHVPGPTNMSRVPGGYELTNRLYRVVISDQTGDVTFWGYKDQSRNMISGRGIYTTLATLPESPMHGYIEKRDEQTWQYLGEDDNRIAWRKIYGLEGDSLFVSILITNNRAGLLTTAIQINGDPISLRIDHHDPELFEGHGGYGSLSLRGYNEFPAPTTQPALPTLIQSDTFHLKPTERQGYTSQWKIVPSGS